MLINRKKQLIVMICLLIVMLIILMFLCIFKIKSMFKKEIFTDKSRINNVIEEKKKDNKKYYKTIGWLRVQGTNIDTPIINFYYEPSDDEEDSKYDDDYIDKENYLWNFNGKEKNFNKVNILGHNILNLSDHPDTGLNYFKRFDDLMSFVYYDFVEDNKYIEYTVGNKNYIYKVYSVEFVKDNDYDSEIYSNYNNKKMNKYIKESINNSLFKFDVDVKNTDKIISLITCTRLF